eukprot:2578783-Rhodomonas_salina.7
MDSTAQACATRVSSSSTNTASEYEDSPSHNHGQHILRVWEADLALRHSVLHAHVVASVLVAVQVSSRSSLRTPCRARRSSNPVHTR